MYVNIFEYIKYLVLFHYNGPIFTSQTLAQTLIYTLLSMFCPKLTAVAAGMAVLNCYDFNACKKYT